MFNPKQLKKILKEAKILDADGIKKAEKESKKLSKALEDYLMDKHIISEELLYETAAARYKVPFVNLKNQIIRQDILFLVPEPIAQTHQLIAYDKTEKELKIVTTDPDDLQTFEFIERKTGLKPVIALTTPTNIREALKQYHKSLKAEFEDITKPEKKDNEIDTPDLKHLAEDLPVIRIVDTLLEYAIFEGASDIHIELQEKEVIIRYRIDGVLRDVMTLPKSAHAGIVARIKVLSNLKLDEHRLPQDGRFKINLPEYKVAFRVSIIPAFEGEKIVLRLLNEGAKPLTLEQLGFQAKSYDIVKRNIAKPHGMILVTGPTGSGKTTTLYTILGILNTSKVNISTVEDPVEYRMPRVNQCQINPKIGFTFAAGLRAFLRQDPNIIMVGEIRDKETAEIAINAALTGHLVLSTLHTNDAVTSLPRLLEMGVPSFLVASTANVIIAQRLVRKICAECIQSYNLTKDNIKELENLFNIPSILDTLEQEGAITKKDKNLEKLLFYKGKGCKQCNSSGYKGRIGIYETLEVTPEISAAILNKSAGRQIAKLAEEQGMLTVVEDGFIKAKSGVTTVEEVIRVTQE